MSILDSMHKSSGKRGGKKVNKMQSDLFGQAKPKGVTRKDKNASAKQVAKPKAVSRSSKKGASNLTDQVVTKSRGGAGTNKSASNLGAERKTGGVARNTAKGSSALNDQKVVRGKAASGTKVSSNLDGQAANKGVARMDKNATKVQGPTKKVARVNKVGSNLGGQKAEKSVGRNANKGASNLTAEKKTAKVARSNKTGSNLNAATKSTGVARSNKTGSNLNAAAKNRKIRREPNRNNMGDLLGQKTTKTKKMIKPQGKTEKNFGFGGER